MRTISSCCVNLEEVIAAGAQMISHSHFKTKSEKRKRKTPGRFTDGEGSIKLKYMSCFSKRNCFLRLVCRGCQSRSSRRPRPPVHQSRTRSRFRTVKSDEFYHPPADYFPPRCIFFFLLNILADDDGQECEDIL